MYDDFQKRASKLREYGTIKTKEIFNEICIRSDSNIDETTLKKTYQKGEYSIVSVRKNVKGSCGMMSKNTN